MCCWKRVLVMTSVFSWQNSVSFCPASFCTLEAKLACYFRYLFCTPIPYNEKDILFLVLVLEGLVNLHRTIELQLFSISSWGTDLDYCDIEWFALRRKILSFLRLHPSTVLQNLLLTMKATSFLLRDSCSQWYI